MSQLRRVLTENWMKESFAYIVARAKYLNEKKYILPTTPIPSKQSSIVVYAISNKKGEVIYIGHTYTLAHRLHRHKCSKKWFNEAAKVRTYECNDRKVARKLEMKLIKDFKPKYNKKGIE